MAGTFPDGALERIRAKLDEVLPGVEKIKVRSSANAEDVPNFDGAGLHDSFAADTDKQDRPDRPCRIELDDDDGEVKRKVKPKSVGCAVRRASTPACGTSGPSRSAPSPGSTRTVSRWGWRSCRSTTSSPRSPPMPWWSPGC